MSLWKFFLLKTTLSLTSQSSARNSLSINKKPEKAPSKQSIVDEIGDVIVRLGVVIEQLEVEEEAVGERVDDKIAKLIKYYNEGKYKGGL
jgi:hypothetical protein